MRLRQGNSVAFNFRRLFKFAPKWYLKTLTFPLVARNECARENDPNDYDYDDVDEYTAALFCTLTPFELQSWSTDKRDYNVILLFAVFIGFSMLFNHLLLHLLQQVSFFCTE